MMETSSNAPHARWWTAIDRRVREKEIRRQLSYALPDIVQEFLKTLTQSVIGFWVVAWLLDLTLHVSAVYTFAAFGIVYSAQATYHKYRLSVDPGYRIPGCKCAGRQNGDTERVLLSRHSAFLGVPNSAVGTVYYATLLVVLAALHQTELLLPIAILACGASAYLSYQMVARIGSLCVNCINLSALNLLIVVWLWLG